MDLHDAGELTPVVAALCALATGPSYLRGIGHIRGHETDRLAALATELRGLGADVTELPDGLELRPATLHGGLFRSYADHRMAHAAAVLGSAVADVAVDDIAATGKTFPAFPQVLVAAAGRAAVSGRYDEHDHEHYERPRRHTRPRTKERPRYDDAVDGRGDHGRPRPVHPRGRTASSCGRSRPARSGARVWSSATGYASSVTSRATEGALARIVEVQERATVLRRTADDDDAGRARRGRERRPARRGHRPGRPRATSAADRPRPGGGVRRRDEAAPVPDQGRPGRPRDAAGDVPPARGAVGRDAARRRPARGPRAARRTHERADRPQRRRQVHARQRARAERRPRDRARERRHRARPAHLDLGDHARAARPRTDRRVGSSTRPGSGRSGWRTCGRRT